MLDYNNPEKLVLHVAENDDSIIKSLNNLNFLLYYETFEPFEFSEVKKILEQAYVDYETLLKSIHLNNNHNIQTKNIYERLIDKEKDNLE